MKIKTLLVAGLAFVAMNAVAQDIHVTDSETKISFDTELIKNLAADGEKSAWSMVGINIADEMVGGATNFEFQLSLPEGLAITNIKDTGEETVAYNPDEDDDIQALSWTGGLNEGTGFYVGVGANLKKTPILKTNFNLCQVRYTKAAELPKGTVIGVEKVKVTDYANNDYTTPRYDITVVPKTESAVENINAGKAVAGVKYYNVAGQAADKAFDGVNVVVTTYVDGTQSVVKVVK